MNEMNYKDNVVQGYGGYNLSTPDPECERCPTCGQYQIRPSMQITNGLQQNIANQAVGGRLGG